MSSGPRSHNCSNRINGRICWWTPLSRPTCKIDVRYPDRKSCWPEAKQLLQSFQRHVTMPCRYCQQTHSNHDRHWFQFPVLSACALIAAHYRHGRPASGHAPGCSGGPFLRPIGATEEKHHHQLREPPTKRQRTEVDSKGKGKGGKGKGKSKGKGRPQTARTEPGMYPAAQMGLQRWFQGRGRDPMGSREHCSGLPSLRGSLRLAGDQGAQVNTTGLEARADSCLPSSGYGDASLHEERREGHGTGAVRHGSKVACHEGGGAGQAELLPQAGALQTTPDLDARTVDRDVADPDSDGACQISGMDDGSTTIKTG